MEIPGPQPLSLAEFATEPFRVFFPAAVVAGLVAVALWPLHLGGVVAFYPGACHARLMGYGLFGGFIFGFLGTALPRMISAKPVRPGELIFLVAVYGVMVAAYGLGNVKTGDLAALVFLVLVTAILVLRIGHRRDTPPPGFVLVPVALACGAAGALLGILQETREMDPFWLSLQKLLAYQGFILLPILGVGGFILPRFFGLPNLHDFPESLTPSRAWLRRAATALGAGLLILMSFVLEASGFHRAGPAVRFLVTLAYLILELPVFRRAQVRNALSHSLRIAFGMLLAGFLTISLFPEYRVALLHFSLIGGFAMITFSIATRVVFGHSGNQKQLLDRNRWLWIAFGLMLLAMATRVSADIWPKVMFSHYIYGAVAWGAGVILWAVYVLPNVVVRDPGD